MEKLKPCPFCGGKAEFYGWSDKLIGNGTVFNYRINCEKCNVSTPIARSIWDMNEDGEIVSNDDCRKELLDSWNNRTDIINEEIANAIDEMFLAKCKEVTKLKKEIVILQKDKDYYKWLVKKYVNSR
jgi:Lar family restriction alleviation protein